jgi:hypothetical protein
VIFVMSSLGVFGREPFGAGFGMGVRPLSQDRQNKSC